MKLDFYPVKTNDDSISLYNTVIEDIYHSSIGAYTEAKLKFSDASKITEFAQKSDEIRILDICYGLGYNSKAAVQEIYKVNPDCKIIIDCIEYDPNVLLLSLLLKFDLIDECININFFDQIFSQLINDKKNINILNELICNKDFLPFYDIKFINYIKKHAKGGVNISNEPQNALSLHNIYYRAISSRNHITPKYPNLKQNLDINVYNSDARSTIKSLHCTYDYVFHDGFTPLKQPSLWSVEMFTRLYKLLSNNGVFVTYSNSAAVRSGLIESGFTLGKGQNYNYKSLGTVAYKDSTHKFESLSEKELGLLGTKAGIPYYDNSFQMTDIEILKNRQTMYDNSDRITSSRFIKDLNKNI